MIDYDIRLSTEEERQTLPGYRYTLLNEAATCPTLAALSFGFIPEDANLDEYEMGERSMALTAGKACHEVFAAVRLYDLMSIDPVLFETHGIRLFGIDRFEKMKEAHDRKKENGERMQKLGFCLEALYSLHYEDDPDDKHRTLANLEQVCAAYIDRWDPQRKLWLSPHDERVGIELPFDLVIEASDGWKVRFRGTLDGLHETIDQRGLTVHENKTGRYINDAWASTFLMSHQVTGYCIAGSVLSGQQVRDALILGTQIPLNTSQPVRMEPVTRETHHVDQWLVWFRNSVEMYEKAKADPITAPKFSHSCNRFFKTCQFMPFCDGDVDEKQRIINRLKQGELA